MRKGMSIIQRVFNAIKASKEPMTTHEIQSELSGVHLGTTVYALLEKGAVKRQDKGGKAAYIATGTEPTFGPARKRRKHNTAMIKAVVDSPAPMEVINPEQIAAQAQMEMAASHSAISSLHNASAFVKFAVMLDRHGPEQMLLMLAGMERMHK